jgi:TetR/AcrR family transcriptional regulator
MYSKFLNLNPEKQERILNAAMKEFADKGFEKASTNEIVKEAGISKGLLFHYFSNKQKLYMFLFDYCIDIMLTEFYGKVDLEERDIFNKLHQIMKIKWELIIKYPQIINYIQGAAQESQSDIKSTFGVKSEKLIQDAYSKIFDNIDTLKFKDAVDAPRVINIIMWTLEGCANNEIKKLQLQQVKRIDYEKAFADANVYIDILKKMFYK